MEMLLPSTYLFNLLRKLQMHIYIVKIGMPLGLKKQGCGFLFLSLVGEM